MSDCFEKGKVFQSNVAPCHRMAAISMNNSFWMMPNTKNEMLTGHVRIGKKI
jgi:hypothetical protein